MASINDIYAEIKNMENAITAKGGKVIKANSNPSLSEIVSGINSINTEPKIINYNTTAPKIVITAELPNVTINLKDNEGNIVDTKSTEVDGGIVELNTVDPGIYIVEAYDTNNEKIWDSEVEIEADKNTYYVKTGKKFNDYEWSEIKQAANGHYAKYMWSIGDKKVLKEWMNIDLTACSNDSDPAKSYHYVQIISFDHDVKVSDGTRAGITFIVNTNSFTRSGINSYITLESSYYKSLTSAGSSYASYWDDPQGFYSNNSSYCNNMWAHVYEAQNNPDTTNTNSFYKDGTVLNTQPLFITIPSYYNNGLVNTNHTATGCTRSLTTERELYWLDNFYSIGLPYYEHQTIGKIYPFLDLNYYDYINNGYYSGSMNIIHSNYYYDSTYAPFKHNWLTGAPRLYTLPKGSEMYCPDFFNKIDSTTSGEYYTYDNASQSFLKVILPDEYDSTRYYFKKYTMTEDGPILRCFPEELRNIMEKVKKYTAAPYFADKVSLVDSIPIVETEDYLYMPSTNEIFGYLMDNSFDHAYDNIKVGTNTTLYYAAKYIDREGEPFINKPHLGKTGLGNIRSYNLRSTTKWGSYNINTANEVISKSVPTIPYHLTVETDLDITNSNKLFSLNMRGIGSKASFTWSDGEKSNSFYLPGLHYDTSITRGYSDTSILYYRNKESIYLASGSNTQYPLARFIYSYCFAI